VLATFSDRPDMRGLQDRGMCVPLMAQRRW